MQTIKSFLDQSLVIWRDSTAAARFGIMLLLFICFAAVIGVGTWSIQPQWVDLTDRLSTKKSGELVTALDQANISNEMRGAGRIVQVKKKDYDLARRIAGDLGVESSTPTLEPTSPWQDPAVQQDISNRNLERKLAASVGKFKQVESAIVSLAIPERQPFLRQKNHPTASVVLTLAANERFDDAMAASIAAHVASSVPGLQIDQVTISDSDGNRYAIDESLGRLTKQEEYRLNRERQIAAKVESVLFPIVGIGNSTVQVTTAFTFPNETIRSTEYDQDKVLSSERIKTTKNTENTAGASGTAGVANNVGNAGRSSSENISKDSTEETEFEYKISEQIREDVSQTPILNFVSVAVAVNSEAEYFGDGTTEIPAEKKKSIESLVRSAVGIREGIDVLTLNTLPFVDPMPLETAPVAAIPWDQINNILKNISLGIAALVALLLGFKAIKNLQPVNAPSDTASRLQGNRASQASQLSEMVKQNPEVFSKIIASWADDETEKPVEQEQQRAA